MQIKVNGKTLELPEGSTPKEAAERFHLTAPEQAVAVSINGKLRDFDTSISEGDEIVFWNFDDTEGKDVFWHTSAHVLAQAILRLCWADSQPTIGPPIENGFYYDFGNLTISDQDFERSKTRWLTSSPRISSRRGWNSEINKKRARNSQKIRLNAS